MRDVDLQPLLSSLFRLLYFLALLFLTVSTSYSYMVSFIDLSSIHLYMHWFELDLDFAFAHLFGSWDCSIVVYNCHKDVVCWLLSLEIIVFTWTFNLCIVWMVVQWSCTQSLLTQYHPRSFIQIQIPLYTNYNKWIYLWNWSYLCDEYWWYSIGCSTVVSNCTFALQCF